MANLDDAGEEGVSLFPMFNILACTLGVMVFVLATIATVSLGADKAVQLVAAESSSGRGLMQATWMEWDGRTLLDLRSGEGVDFIDDLRSIPTFEDTYDHMFGRLAGTPVGAELADVSSDPERYLILLVRPSGFRTLPEIRGYLELLSIDVVEEPIDVDWRRLRVR
jgi:hypothetical protein